MAGYKQIFLYFILLLMSKTIHTLESATQPQQQDEELVESESKDGKLEIVKRIKKINDDGSYTIGYEADDGSFKIESRNVLGHIKGTYGFLDEEGKIKRVSYSTNNSSEIINKPDAPSVVQRIPTRKQTTLPATRKPTYIFSSTQSTPLTTSNSVVQSITKRKTTTSSTTTQKPNYDEVVNIGKATTKPNYVTYTSAPPRVLLQGGASFSATESTRTNPVKSEGQLIRPEVVTVRPTEIPLYRRLNRLEDEKPVNEEIEQEVRANILRRDLPQRHNQPYNIQEHVFRLQQSIGRDATDVYSNSMTTGTPRPLFTTTTRPKNIGISTAPEPVPIPTAHYPLNYQRNVLQDVEQNYPQYLQETTTYQPSSIQSTPTPTPVVQIPANRAETKDPLVAIQHPFESGTILVPLSQLRGRIIPMDNLMLVNGEQRQYDYQQEQYLKETPKQSVVEIEQQKAIVRRLPLPSLMPIPVQVDENGYIRDLPRQAPAFYPVPVPTTPIPKYADTEADNSIDNIQPPVSTKDFQKLLHQLIMRQSRLEKISAIARQNENYIQQQRYRPAYSSPDPYSDQGRQSVPMRFVQQQRTQAQRPPYQNFVNPQQLIPLRSESQQNLYDDQYEPQYYRPNRRVARLLPSRAQRQQELQEEFLPSDVREMLLLRMLQLAINPSLPVDEEDLELVNKSPTVKRMQVRNVEILGEENSDEPKGRTGRTKRYRESVDY